MLVTQMGVTDSVRQELKSVLCSAVTEGKAKMACFRHGMNSVMGVIM